MKKLLLLILTVLLPIVTNANVVEIDGIYYNIVNKLKTAEVTSNPNKYVGNLTIPDKIIHEGTEYDVTSIGNAAFYKCTELTSIVIGNNVTTITNAAFTGCTGLNSISLGNSVTSIKYKAFYNCKSITSVTIPQSVNYIERDAFAGCTGLKEVRINNLESWCNISFDYASNPLEYAHHLFLNDEEIKNLVIPNNISSIGCYAFSGCTGLTEITIPNHFESISEGAFKGCEGLTSLTIPSSVKKIESVAFQSCTGLTSITIPGNVEVIAGSAFSSCSGLKTLNLSEGLISIGSFAFEGCKGVKSLTIPNSVTSIGEWSLSVCEGLVSVSIGSGIKDIGGHAFGLCPELTDVYCFSKLVPKTDDDAFSKSFIEHATLHVPASSISLYQNAMPWKNFKEIVKIDVPIHILKYMIDGETYKTFEIEEGEAITAEPEPTKEGYTFSGWSDIPETMPAHDVTVTGSFTVNKYKLIYKVDGNEYKSYELEYGATITPETAPTKEGYTFSGWSEIPETMPAHEVMVTGTFSVNKYKLIYTVDGEEYKSYKLDYGATITETTPTKEGYTFSGWSEIPETMPAHDVTVTGTFTINKYKLTYIVDGEEYKSYEIDYGASITPEPAPTKEGYTFSGWSEIQETMPAHDVTVTGSFIVNKYKLIYKVDGAYYKTYELEYGAKITPEPAPTKEGYTFSGWSEIPETMPAHDVTVTGTFTINKYKLTYMVDDAEYKSCELEYGATITPEPAPTKEGYTFSGWSEIPETMPAHDVTVTGTFTINKYKLTYIVDGEEYKSYEIDYGASITPEPAPTKEGYTFSGWSEIPETMPAHDVTVTGSFIVNKYKLIYKVDGAYYKTYELEYGAKITPEPAPTKEGYTFSGWSEIPETMPAHDVTVTGTFTINKYKLTYMVDDAEYKSCELEYGATITPELAPTKEGYTFSGWSEIPETMPAHDVTVTGTFTKGNYKLTYIVDGEIYKTISYDYGDVITPEPTSTKEGYTFSGWSEIPETMPAHDVTVTGTFTINKYKLTYIVDGQTYKTYDVKYGAAITPEAEPTKEGYTFSGWSGIPETMPAHDITVTGTFTKGAYILTYMVDGKVYKTVSYDYGNVITAEPAPTMEGYTFSGWSEIPETMPAHDVTVTGTFTINKYKLIYTVDGEEYNSYELDYGATITPEPAPTKEGYTFSGWSEIPETMPAHDVTVTGTFSINSHKLTYMIDDKVYKETMYEYGATITPEPQPEGDYATFEWTDLPQTMPAHDVVVYANYTSGIIEVLMTRQGNIRIYSPNGKKLDKLQKGLNIVVLDDGTVKKVIVK